MLEGKEIDKKLGKYGSVSVDLTDELDLEIAASAKVNLLDLALKAKSKITNKTLLSVLSFMDKYTKRGQPEAQGFVADQTVDHVHAVDASQPHQG